jgi:hypothetical protein
MSLDFVRSGSRIVAMGYSAGSAKTFRTFYDKQGGFDCDFVAASSGEDMRCVPSVNVSVIYQDPECTRPAAWISSYDGLVTNDAVSGGPTRANCPGDVAPHRESYRIGKQLSEEALRGTGPVVFEKSSTGCGPAYIPGKVAPSTFELIPLDEAELARGIRSSVKVSERLRVSRLLAEDGAELNLGVTTVGGASCAFQGDDECVPELLARPFPAASGKFQLALNADCSVPAFQTPFAPECGQPQFGLLAEGAGAPRVFSLEKPSAVFAWRPVSPMEAAVNFSCVAIAAESDDAAAPARELTGTFPKAETALVGDGQLQVPWRMAGNNQLLPALADPALDAPGVVPRASFVDEEGRPCQVLPADDGTERCAPYDANFSSPPDLTSYPQVVWGPL